MVIKEKILQCERPILLEVGFPTLQSVCVFSVADPGPFQLQS